MNLVRLAILAVALPTAFFACTPVPPKCSASTCSTGCCSATGVCETGSSSAACGRQGAACTSCSLGTVCNSGTCQPTSGVGGGSAAGGSAAGGSAAGGSAAGGSAAGGSAAGGSAAGGSAAGGSAAGGSAAGGSAGGSTGCSSANCSGCCLPNGTCQAVPDNRLNTTCGSNGDTCADCTVSSTTCGFSGSTYSGMRSSGGGSAAGGSAAGGSAAGGSAAGGSAAGGSAAGGSAAGGSAAGGSAAGGSAAGGSAGDVTGTVTSLNYLVNGTTAMSPFNLSAVAIEAWVPNGSSYTVLTGTGQVNGTFRVPNVPMGPYLMRVGASFLQTTARQTTFYSYNVGRAGAAVANVNPTTMNLNLTGALPWINGQDQIVWVSPNLGNTFYNFQSFSSTMPTVGATSINLSVNMNGVELASQAAGDDTWALQFRGVADGGYFQGGVVAGGQLPPFTQQNGQTTTVSATLLSPPTLPSLTQSFNWNLNAFSALQLSLPAGTNPRGTFVLSPFPATTGNTLGVVDLWFAQIPAANLPPSSFTLVTPFPSGWAITGRVFFVVDTPRTVAGTSGPAALISGFGHFDSMATLTSSPITPRLGPVTNVTLNGTPFTSDRTSVGTMTLNWTPPSLGTPNTYFIGVNRLTGVAGMPTAIAESFTVSVAGPPFVVPSQLLVAGQPYVFEINAVTAGFNSRVEYSSRVVPYASSFIVTPIARP
ncbi:MAG: hypothetical protein JNJ54_24975 [Myxococcaceae bacterium]|nr:hypothetical protein [Myxococcaceae bacterium]